MKGPNFPDYSSIPLVTHRAPNFSKYIGSGLANLTIPQMANKI